MAAARFDDFSGELPAEAVVLTTTCDQIRYAAALLQHLGRLPVFLLHVPRTWQTAAVRAFYREELGRLGRFLVGCGGTSPQGDALSQTMLRYDRARASLRLRRARDVGQGLCTGDRRRPRRTGGERGRRGQGEREKGRRAVSLSPRSLSPRSLSPRLRGPRSLLPVFPWRSSVGRCPRAITNC